jgi:hypothetical protein
VYRWRRSSGTTRLCAWMGGCSVGSPIGTIAGDANARFTIDSIVVTLVPCSSLAIA